MRMLPERALRKIDLRIRMARSASGADAFLASFPKSGRTWFRFLLSHYFAALADGDAHVDLHTMFTVVPNYDLDPQRGIPAFAYQDRRDQVPLILVSHHDYRVSLYLRRPVIFMIRDPRDVMVSAYFHATRHKHRFKGDIDGFLMDPVQGLPRLAAYLNGWARGLARHRHFVLSYEALTADTMGVSANALEFLGLRAEPDLARAVAAARFEAMREHEIKAGLPAHHYDRTDEESLRMRKGKVGGFSDYLTAAQIEMIEQFCRSELCPAAQALVATTGMGGQPSAGSHEHRAAVESEAGYRERGSLVDRPGELK